MRSARLCSVTLQGAGWCCLTTARVHVSRAFNEKVDANPMGGAGIAHESMTRLVCNPKTLAALDAVGCKDKKFCAPQPTSHLHCARPHVGRQPLHASV